jgi:drug/metabolite transporter (DMT)-like permease
MRKEKATLIGLSAIILWSTIIAFTRILSNDLGGLGAGAVMYTSGFILLVVCFGFPSVKTFSRRYLFFGSILFAGTIVTQCCSIGFAHSGRQVIEISMINYLWPSLTILFAILFKIQKSNWAIIPGLIMAITGVTMVISGDDGFNLEVMLLNIKDNPLSYGLALLGAFIWATYSTVTAKIAEGQNGATFFFLISALAMWIMYFAGDVEPLHFTLKISVFVFLSAISCGFGYSAWNVGIMHGNVTILATASYFVPILSVLTSSILLDVPLSFSFWRGAILVCIGSMICWISTKKRNLAKEI